MRRAYEILDQREEREREHELWLERHRDPITGRIDLGTDETQPEPTQQRRTSEGSIYKTFRHHSGRAPARWTLNSKGDGMSGPTLAPRK